MESESAVKGLAGLRVVIGLAAWLAPRQAAKGFGLNPDANPQVPYIGRLFGARDVALGDAVAALAAGRGGYLPPVSAALVFVTAVAAAALGAVALQGDGTPG